MGWREDCRRPPSIIRNLKTSEILAPHFQGPPEVSSIVRIPSPSAPRYLGFFSCASKWGLCTQWFSQPDLEAKAMGVEVVLPPALNPHWGCPGEGPSSAWGIWEGATHPKASPTW